MHNDGRCVRLLQRPGRRYATGDLRCDRQRVISASARCEPLKVHESKKAAATSRSSTMTLFPYRNHCALKRGSSHTVIASTSPQRESDLAYPDSAD